MADLVAIGYPDETTAEAAADEARRLAADLVIEPDAIAVIVRDKDGTYHIHATHHPVAAGGGLGHVLGITIRPAVLHPGPRDGGGSLDGRPDGHDGQVPH